MAGGRYTRRQVLAGGVGGVAGILAATGGATARAAASVKPAGSDLGAIEHVVFLMHENRSFDHYFGTYKGVRGFDDHPADDLGVFAQPWPGGADPTLLPFHLNTLDSMAECTFDLSHTWQAEHASWNNGAMDSFVSTHTSSAYEGKHQGVLTMGYYKEPDLRFYYALADAFTICDRYHCSVLGPTHPNRLFQMSGTNDPDGLAGGPILVTNDESGFDYTVSWTTMPERLDASGVSWKVYNPFGPDYKPPNAFSMLLCKNVLMYFEQYSDQHSSLYQNAFGYCGPNVHGDFTGGLHGPDDFARDVRTDQLPAVSWIIPPDGFDEHPPAPPVLGEWYTHQVLNTLLSNPKVWAKTVLFIMYDENDGWFDHVPPPTPPPGTPGEYITVDPLPPEAGGIAGPIGLGVRVPMLVVSPFSKGGWVCSDTFDHTSQLRFLETRFGVEVPNLSPWRRSVTGDLTSTLPHITRADTGRPALPNPSDSLRQHLVFAECNSAQLIELNFPTKPYPVPTDQTMPTQEPGTLRRTPT